MRRARRLLPALILVLLAVALFGAFVATDDEALGLRGDLLGSLFYVQNWRFVLSGASYFTQFGSPSPLRHMWSLAIEEQWYLVWPLMLFGIMALTRRNLRAVTAIILALAAGSALLMAALYHQGGDASRAYYGTDTRAQALLVGAALAVLFTMRIGAADACRDASCSRCSARSASSFLAWVVVEQSERWTTLYRGGFSLVALASAALIAGAMTRGPVRSVLAIQPLPAIGLISYGLYLWHWPIFVWLSPDRTGLEGHRLLALRLVVTLAVSIASFFLVERPIREQRLSWVRGRALWIPITSAVTAGALLLLTASGAAARPRPNLSAVEQFTRILNAPPPPGSTRVLLAGDSIAVTLGFDAVRPSQRKDIWLRGVARVGCGLLTGTPVSGDTPGQSQEECHDWPQKYAKGVQRVQAADVSLLLIGGWEVFDREIDGTTVRVGTPADGGRVCGRARPGDADPHRERRAPRDPHDAVLLSHHPRARRVRRGGARRPGAGAVAQRRVAAVRRPTIPTSRSSTSTRTRARAGRTRRRSTASRCGPTGCTSPRRAPGCSGSGSVPRSCGSHGAHHPRPEDQDRWAVSLKPRRLGRPPGAPTRVIDATSRCIRHAEQRIAVHRPERRRLDRRDVAHRDDGSPVDQLVAQRRDARADGEQALAARRCERRVGPPAHEVLGRELGERALVPLAVVELDEARVLLHRDAERRGDRRRRGPGPRERAAEHPRRRPSRRAAPRARRPAPGRGR